MHRSDEHQYLSRIVDFHAQFPVGEQSAQIAGKYCVPRALEFPDFTAEAREMLKRASLQRLFQPGILEATSLVRARGAQ